MSKFYLPQRYKPMESITDLVSHWDVIKKVVRPEFENDTNIERAHRALSVGLTDAAINYFWNLTIYDLYRKIIAYGIDYFSTAINWEGAKLKDIEDLREVKDYQILSGAFSLGIISNEAHFYLQQCREIRNNFSTAHYPIGELDLMETCNFIKNCIKYGLTHDLPAPGLQIKELLERLAKEKLHNGEEIIEMINGQAQRIKGPIMHSLFSKFIRQDCDANTKHNIKLIAPVLWKDVADDVRSTIAQKYASLKEMKDSNTEKEALAFLELVGGVSYIPETYKHILFKKAAVSLIDAHFGWDNFYNEPGYAKDLAMLGMDVPPTALRIYVKAILLSYIGNLYGISDAAQKYDEKMLCNLSQSGIICLFSILDNDPQVLSELAHRNPVKRLIKLIALLSDKTIQPENKAMFEFIQNGKENDIYKHFNKKYFELD